MKLAANTAGAYEPVPKYKRASLTPKERDAMWLAQKGVCAWPGCTNHIRRKGARAEHWTQVWMGNEQKPDCLICDPHAKIKDAEDAAKRGKVRRIRKRGGLSVKKPTNKPIRTKRSASDLSQYEKRKKFGPAMKSRNGFQEKRK